MSQKKKITMFSVAILVVLLLLGSIYWFSYGQYIQSTDNAYIHGNLTTISAQVSGQVLDSKVKDNQHVKANQLLAQIDPAQYQQQLAQAKAMLALSMAEQGTLQANRQLQQALIQQAEAEVSSAQASYQQAERELNRQKSLNKKNYTSQDALDKARSTLTIANATLHQANASLQAAHDRLNVFNTQLKESAASIERAEAGVAEAELNLSHTEIRAPVDGIIGARSLRKGMLAAAGMPLLSLVPTSQIWIVANFKETQVGSIHAGQKVTISIDALPDASLYGSIESMSPATGAQFALLPPENATGNFTKIVQRIPVKIVLNESDIQKYHDRLLPGLSAVITVDTRG